MGRAVCDDLTLTMSAKLYRRLPGRGRSIGFAVSPGRYTLWVAPDHLLSLEARVGSETYRRFYFRDIEAFIVRRTVRRRLWNWTLIILAFLSAGPFVALWQRNPDQIGWLITALALGGLWLLLALANTLRGPTCSTHIRTPVQIENLPSLGRLKTFNKVLAQVQPFIDHAQSGLEPEHLPAAENAQSVPEPSSGSGAPQRIGHEPGHIHTGLFCILLLMGALTLWDVQAASKVSTSLDLLISLVGTLLLIFALRRQSNSDLSPAVKRITWCVLVYYVVGVFAGASLGVMFAIHHPGQPPPNDPLFLRAEPGYSEIMTTSGVAALLLAIIGLAFLHLRRRSAAGLPSA